MFKDRLLDLAVGDLLQDIDGTLALVVGFREVSTAVKCVRLRWLGTQKEIRSLYNINLIHVFMKRI